MSPTDLRRLARGLGRGKPEQTAETRSSALGACNDGFYFQVNSRDYSARSAAAAGAALSCFSCPRVKNSGRPKGASTASSRFIKPSSKPLDTKTSPMVLNNGRYLNIGLVNSPYILLLPILAVAYDATRCARPTNREIWGAQIYPLSVWNDAGERTLSALPPAVNQRGGRVRQFLTGSPAVRRKPPH